jgi:hypothetical protein
MRVVFWCIGGALRCANRVQTSTCVVPERTAQVGCDGLTRRGTAAELGSFGRNALFPGWMACGNRRSGHFPGKSWYELPVREPLAPPATPEFSLMRDRDLPAGNASCRYLV